MKPQPLKGKEAIYDADYIETEIRFEIRLGDRIFNKKDVKSAVEWFREKIREKLYQLKKDIGTFTNDERDGYFQSSRDSLELLDEAFEDVK